MQDQSIQQASKALNKRINRYHKLIGRAVESGDGAAVTCYLRDLHVARAELAMLDRKPIVDEDELIERIAYECATEISRYWHDERVLRDKGIPSDDLSTRMQGVAHAYKSVFGVLGCDFDFAVDPFDGESRISRFTARRRGSNAVVFSMQNFGKDEWWA